MVKVIDLFGKVFGDWKVICRKGSSREGRANWLCKCLKCGYEKTITGKSLISKRSTRCNKCSTRAKEYALGEKIGSLVILKRLENDKHGFANWLCQCEQPVSVVKYGKDGGGFLETNPCGKILEVLGIRLRGGQKMCRTCSSRAVVKKKRKNLLGEIYGRLTVVGLDELRSVECNSTYWVCKCLCGNFSSVRQDGLIGGGIKSCGCLQRDVAKDLKSNLIHGLSKDPLYIIYSGIKQRCSNSNSPAYKNYGKKGIQLCDLWFNDFKLFYNWANENGYQKGMTIDRIDSSKGYSPENCQILSKEAHFIKTANDRGIATVVAGKQLNLHKIAKKSKIYSQTALELLEAGWDEQNIIEFGKLQLHQKRIVLSEIRAGNFVSLPAIKEMKKKIIKPQIYSKGHANFRSMLSRCYNPKDPSFKYYGGKGIGVSPIWILGKFKQFINDMGSKLDNNSYHIDRVCTDRDYCLENCRWLSAQENCERRCQKLNKEEAVLSLSIPKGNLCREFLANLGHPLANKINLNILGVSGIRRILELADKGVFLSEEELVADLQKNKSEINLKGRTIGRLFVEDSLVERDKSGRPRVKWQCLCVCGTRTIVSHYSLVHYKTLSCGCLHREKSSLIHQKNKYSIKHGCSKQAFYRLWINNRKYAMSTNQPTDPEDEIYQEFSLTLNDNNDNDIVNFKLKLEHESMTSFSESSFSSGSLK